MEESIWERQQSNLAHRVEELVREHQSARELLVERYAMIAGQLKLWGTVIVVLIGITGSILGYTVAQIAKHEELIWKNKEDLQTEIRGVDIRATTNQVQLSALLAQVSGLNSMITRMDVKLDKALERAMEK